MIGVGGTVAVVIPDIGEVPLGSGYMLYDYPGYVAAGGELDAGIKDLITIDGRLDGQFNVANRRFNLSGEVQGCVEDICGKMDAVISSAGVGLCFGDFGGGFKWDDFPNPHIYGRVLGIGVACGVAKFTEDHVFATGDGAHTASAARTLVVRRGRALPEVRLDGASGAPNVTVTGPGGQSLTASGLGVHRAGSIIVIQSERLGETVIGFTHSVPGTYTIAPIAGPAVVRSYHSSEPPPTSVSGHVTGVGTRRVLRYAASRQPDERITFLEVVHGLRREIGSTAGGRGTLRFTTLPGPGPRTIVAAVTRNGISVPGAQRLPVARFSGPAFVRPGPVGGLSARWRGGALLVSWPPARNAARYVVTLRERRGGLIRMTTRSRALRLTAASPTLGGVVSVVPLSADGSRGPAASVRYRAGRAPASRFRPFSELRKGPATRKG